NVAASLLVADAHRGPGGDQFTGIIAREIHEQPHARNHRTKPAHRHSRREQRPARLFAANRSDLLFLAAGNLYALHWLAHSHSLPDVASPVITVNSDESCFP